MIKNSMKKTSMKLIAILGCMILSAAFALTGCGNGSAAGEQETAPDGEQISADTEWADDYSKILSDPYEYYDELPPDDITVSAARGELMDDYCYDKYFLYDLDQNGIPELYLCQKDGYFMLIATYNGQTTECSGLLPLSHFNPATKEALQQGGWPETEGSGENEWRVYTFNDIGVLCRSVGFDHVTYPDEDACYIYEAAEELSEDLSDEIYDISIDDYNKLYEEHIKGAMDISDIRKYDLNDRSAFAEFGVPMEDADEVNEMEVYGGTLRQIETAVNDQDYEAEGIPSILLQYIQDSVFFDGGYFEVDYDLKDLDGNGMRELVIQVCFDEEESGDIVGIYTIKGKKAVLLKNADNTEVTDPGLDSREFNWTPIPQII